MITDVSGKYTASIFRLKSFTFHPEVGDSMLLQKSVNIHQILRRHFPDGSILPYTLSFTADYV
jgi:hypothetical protein